MTFLWLTSKRHNKFMVKKSIFWLRMKLRSVQLSISTNSIILLHSTAKLVQLPWLRVLFHGSTNSGIYNVSTYLQILPLHRGIEQCQVRNKNYFNSSVNTKKSIINENNNKNFFENKNFRVSEIFREKTA